MAQTLEEWLEGKYGATNPATVTEITGAPEGVAHETRKNEGFKTKPRPESRGLAQRQRHKDAAARLNGSAHRGAAVR